MVRKPKKSGQRQVSMHTPVRVKTLTATKLGLATAFLGLSVLAAAAAVNLPKLETTSKPGVTIGVQMETAVLPDQVQMIPKLQTNTDGAPIMAVRFLAPRGETATLRKIAFNVIRATDIGWSGDPTGCGFSTYSLTTADGTLLGLVEHKGDETSSVQFTLASPLVISDSVTIQLRPVSFFSEVTQLSVAQALHGCRLLPALAASAIDFVGHDNQPLPVLGGPVYGAITQVLLNQPTVGWSTNAPETVVATALKLATVANLEIRNSSRAGQPLYVTSLPLIIRTNAVATEPVTITWTPSSPSQPAFTQTLLPEEWRPEMLITPYAPGQIAWPIGSNETATYAVSLNSKVLQGQPGWFLCTSVPTGADLTWNFGDSTLKTSPARLPEFCVVKP